MKHRRQIIPILVILLAFWFYRDNFFGGKTDNGEEAQITEKTSDGHPILYSSNGNTRADVIYNEPSQYGDIIVFDFEGTRCFLIDSANESCWTFETGKPSEYVGDTQFLIENLAPEGGDILVIGMGAGTLLKTLDGKNYKVDAVEINPKMPGVAEKYFGKPKNLDFEVTVDDGRHFLETTDKRYDAIIMDICYVNAFNAHLWTKEYYALAKEHLKNDSGFLVASLGVVNNESNVTLENKIANAMGESFSDVYVMDRGKRYEGQFDMEVFFATNRSRVLLPERTPNLVLWKFNHGYTPSVDSNLDEFVKLFTPATEAIIAQSKKNFGERLFLPR